MNKAKNIVSLLLGTCLVMHVGCVSLLAQLGETADIRGHVVMPDGTPAKEVVLFVTYERMYAHGPFGFGDTEQFDERIYSKDGKFHLRYSDVTEVSLSAVKPGLRSYNHEFRDELRVRNLVVELRPAGEFRDTMNLVDVRCMLELEPKIEGGGVKLGKPRRGTVRDHVPIEQSDFYVKRDIQKGPDGQETERLLFKVREGFGLHIVTPPKSKYVSILLTDLTLAPEGPYDTTEIVLPHRPIEEEPPPISGYFRTPDGKYGAFQIWRYQGLQTKGGELLWRIDFSYLLNPDGTRNLNTLGFVEFDEEGQRKK
jgi:hypothetical protein